MITDIKRFQINENKQDTDTITELALLLFTVQDKAKVFHLSSKSFSQHKALEELYTELLDLSDALLEVIQGQYQLIDIVGTIELKKEEPISYLNGVQKEIRNIYKKINKNDTHILNILDECTSLIYRIIYKLTYLK